MTQPTTPPPVVHITFVLDRSGSMQSIRNDVVGGFNQFLAEQQAQPGACKLTMVQFDSQGYDYLHLAQDIANVRPMTAADFVPRGGTPLYDSIGRAITEADVRVGAMTTPEVQLFVILTDGQENQSTKYDRQTIFVMIEEHQAKGWTFSYLGANQDAYAQGAAMGIAAGSVTNYLADSVGTYAAYASTSSNVSHLRSQVAKGTAPDPQMFFAKGKDAEVDFDTRGRTKAKVDPDTTGTAAAKD